ncbi:hypothetical protein CBR_g40137 [Chara braunii]|uniref:Uncharacterized protein n=1 Tax=Chara braunii TaxID=69332 RepID=A0A388LT47_CHABU|nr:hypothetical protein CBR_g40137 [Chara braunii]|eukprot:GBG85498.1 hypothetical protein CBR_g40137 [Chara braunii]
MLPCAVPDRCARHRDRNGGRRGGQLDNQGYLGQGSQGNQGNQGSGRARFDRRTAICQHCDKQGHSIRFCNARREEERVGLMYSNMDGDIYDQFGEYIDRMVPGGVRAEAQSRVTARQALPATFRLWQEKEDPPIRVEEVGSNEEVTQRLRAGDIREEPMDSEDENEEEKIEPPLVLLGKMEDLLDKVGRYQQKLVDLCEGVKEWRASIPKVFLYDFDPKSMPGRPEVTTVGSGPRSGMMTRPPTPQEGRRRLLVPELERIPGNKNRADGLSRINWDKQEEEAVENTPPVDGFLDQEEDIRLHINELSPRVPSCVGHPSWRAPSKYERKVELILKPFEEEDPWGSRDVQWMMKLALTGTHSLVKEVRTIEEGPYRVEKHDDLMGGMYLPVIESSNFTKTGMPRGGKGMRPPRRPLGASGGYERHGSHHQESTPVYDDGDIELFLDEFWGYTDHMSWTVTQAIGRLRGADRFVEPIAQIRREARTRPEVEARMQEL